MEKGFFPKKFWIPKQILVALLLSCLFSAQVPAAEIKSIDFHQENEESKLVIEMDTDSIIAERFHVAKDKQIVLDIKNAKATPKLLRPLDTSEFPGSVVLITPYKKPGTEGDMRFAIQLRDNVRSTLTQNGKKVILSVENRFGVFNQRTLESVEKGNTSSVVAASKEEPNSNLTRVHIPKSDSVEDILANLTLSGPKKYIGKRISLNVKDLSVEDVLKIIADSSGFNIIIDQAVKSSSPLTLSLNNLPWDQVLDTVLGLGKLVAIKNGNILIINTLQRATEEKKVQLEAEELNKKEEPLITKIFPISFATLNEMQTIIKEYITKRGAISSDDRTNNLIIKDTAESLDRIKKIVETLDTETPQILIEAKVIEANESFRKEFGFANGISFGYDPIVKPIPDINIGPGFSFSTISNGGTAASAIGMTIEQYRRISGLDFNLKLMESESKGKIISSPRVITQNKKAATITSTESKSFATTTNNNGVTETNFQTVSVNMTLNVTPQVTNDGSIILQINLTKGGFGAQVAANLPPETTNRTVNTTVLVDNGSTVVIGGIYNYNKSESHQGIPYLKDIPILGWLFKTPYNPAVDKNELMIFLTPRIINQEEAGLVDREDEVT